MGQVDVKDKKICVDDERILPLSGEVHYWRLDPANWLQILQRVRALELDVVATYVCWDFHEVELGQYDFTGKTDPRRNLIGFLELLTAQGFWIILRPGPYIYSEWHNNGVPDHAAKHHRLAPEFQTLARSYMKAVVDAVHPHLATNGGRIILWQADNEIDAWPHWYTEELGLGQRSGPFQEFLRSRYGEIDRLNTIWGTNYQAFEQARAVCAMSLDNPVRMRRFLDFARFQHDYVNQVAAWSVETYRELGVDVPMILNTYSGVGSQRWEDLEKIADIVGPDIYPSQEFDLRANEHRNFMEAVRYTCTYSRLPYIAEFQSGIWHDWLPDVGTLTPNHYRLLCISAMMAGVAGWNWYMLVNRDNWYQSPINEWGRTRPDLYAVFQQIVNLYRKVDPTRLNRVVSTAVTYVPLQRATERPGQDLLQAFYEADIDYEFFDVDGEKDCDAPILFYAGGTWLSDRAQNRLLNYVEKGGQLVLIGTFPELDETLAPCNLLQLQQPDGIVNGLSKMPLKISWGDELHSPWMFNYAAVHGTPITVKRLPVRNLPAEELSLQWNLQAGQEYTVGYTESRGKGRLTVIGLEPTSALLKSIHDHFEVPIPVRSLTPGVMSGLLQSEQNNYLYVVNPGNEDKTAIITFESVRLKIMSGEAIDLISGKKHPFNLEASNSITLTLPRKDGMVLRLEGKNS